MGSKDAEIRSSNRNDGGLCELEPFVEARP